jgi:predicted TIM-barrel fold metal-dependent hydrolase
MSTTSALRIVLPLLVAGAMVAPPIGAQARLPIIDMHMHATRPGGQPDARPCYPEPNCDRVPAAAKSDADVLRLTLEAMDRYNIVLGFLSDNLDNVDKWVQAAPGRFLPSPMIADPTRVDFAALRTAYQSGKLRGMGELSNQYQGIAANEPIMDPIFALAEEFDLPVLIHMGGTAASSAKFKISQGHPELLQDVLVRHPKLRLYLENAGFPFLEETIALLYRYPNVYADISTITWIFPRPIFQSYLHGLVDAGLAKRLMFGSDQMAWPETIGVAIAAIESVEFLTPEQKRDIFYNNAARFLRLPSGAAKRP